MLFAPAPRDLAGVLLVLFVAARLAPIARELVAARVSDARIAFGLALVLYAAIGIWGIVEMPAQGDQPHYLLTTAALASGDLDARHAYADRALYAALTEQRLTEAGVAEHVVAAPAGPRLLQGYGFSLLLLPGWVLGGRLGVTLELTALAALASAATFLIARDVFGSASRPRLAWLLATTLAPVAPLATIVYPNAAGAALIAIAFRWLFTAARARPTAAGVAAGLTLAMTPRDGISALLLALAVLLLARSLTVRFAIGFVGAAAAVAILGFVIYGVPLPYVGYLIALRDPVPTLPPLVVATPQLSLAGILFDRTSGIAASAPWLFIGLAGLASLLRTRAAAARAVLIVSLGTVAALSFYAEWRGGWSPPNRYLVEIVPLWTLFVGAAFEAASRLSRAIAGVLIAWSAAIAVLFAGIPAIAYGDRVTEWFTRAGASHPLSFLPLVAHDDAASIWLRSAALLAALAVIALAADRGARRAIAPLPS